MNGGPTNGGGGGNRGGYANGNPYGGPYYGTGDPRDPRTGNVRPEDFQNNYTQTLQTLRQLEQQAGNDPAMVKDLQNLIRDMQRLSPSAYGNDPLLTERIQTALMGSVQQVEMELRRKVEDASGTGSVRSAGGEKVPQGYQDKVAEYYRKLSSKSGTPEKK
jgi:hypothetical protein